MILASLLAAGCAPLATQESRAGKSSLTCMRSALAGRSFEGMHDAEVHCIATGLVALRCSVTESWLAGLGKEMRGRVKCTIVAGRIVFEDGRIAL